jgi:hypothetical protein
LSSAYLIGAYLTWRDGRLDYLRDLVGYSLFFLVIILTGFYRYEQGIVLPDSHQLCT